MLINARVRFIRVTDAASLKLFYATLDVAWGYSMVRHEAWFGYEIGSARKREKRASTIRGRFPVMREMRKIDRNFLHCQFRV